MNRARTTLAAKSFIFIMLLLLVPHLAMADGNEITVTTVTEVGSRLADNTVLLTLTAGESSDDAVYSVRWRQDSSGWFPVWNLELYSDLNVLPVGAATKTDTTNGSAAYMTLASGGPLANHTYETDLSFDPAAGILAIKVRDVTDDRIVYANGFNVPIYDGPVHAPSGRVQHVYLPVGATWRAGVRSESGTFLALHHFETRQEPAVVRLQTPGPISGEYRFTLETDEGALPLATVRPTSDETWIPLPLAEFPLGSSVLRVDYVDDGAVQYSAEQPIGVGRVDMWIDPLAPDQQQGIVTTVARVRSAEPLTETVSASVWADLYELVWDEEQRNFADVLQTRIPLYDDTVDLTTGDAELTLQWDMPAERSNWRIVVGASFEPTIVSHVGGKERLFSTHLPAVIEEGQPYTIAVLPDTQYFASTYPYIYTRMTDWLTANARDMGIAAVLHVGDITDNDTPTQWERAYMSQSLLHGVIPYALTLGNHDMTNGRGGQVSQRGLSLINNYFKYDEAVRYNNLAGSLVPGKLENHYYLYSIGGDDYVVVALEFGPPDEAVEWAGEIAAKYPDHRFILLTHSYTSKGGGLSRSPAGYPLADNPDTTVNTAEEMWYKLVRQQPNTFMVISGHTAPDWPTVPYRQGRTIYGNPVFELLFDWQFHEFGGNGWLGLLTFNPDDTVVVQVYSPFLGRYADDTDDRGFPSYYEIHHNTGIVRRLRY